MLMSLMRRGNVVLLLVLAVFLAGQPYVHQHPLILEGHDNGSASPVSLPCVVCVTSTASVLVEVPRILAPVPTSETVSATPSPARPTELTRQLPSRAPPTA